MPIILDSNSKDDNTKQMKAIQSKLNQNKDVKSSWFQASLTGSKTRTVGFFNKDNYTLAEVTKDAMNKIGNPKVVADTIKTQFQNKIIHEFSNPKAKEGYFVDFARAITNIVMPSLFANYQPEHVSNIANTSWSLDATTIDDVQFNRDTALFNFDMMEHWEPLTDSNSVKTVVKPIVESYQLASALTKSASANTNNSYSTTGTPMIFLAVASMHHDVEDDAKIHLGKTTVAPSKDRINLSIIPVDMTTSDMFLMTNYVGPKWYRIMEKMRDHYQRSGLTDLNSSVRGPLDVDSELMDMHETISNLSIFNAITEQANTTVNHTEEVLAETFDALLAFHKSFVNTKHEENVTEYVVRSLQLSVQVIDSFSYKEEIITTDFLNVLYQKLKNSSLKNDSTNSIVQESLRLLLSQRLHELKAVEDAGGLYEFKAENDAVTQKYMNDPSFSNQQKRILTTTEPLVIGQAGAGSGKSHTLIGRIKYLREQDEDLSKALVLSFTNVSAININQRFPDIRSETLANMFNQIYLNTYPNQQLSQPSTVANSLALLNPDTNFFKNKGYAADEVADYIERFARTLGQLDQSGFKRVNVQEVTKNLANLIQHNIELTEVLLDAVEQTTLELQPIIIHHHLMDNNGQLNVPDEYQELQYIITDESQDISTFEYILLLELAIHHSAQLLIVGDGSQTLYEFRNSDPKYMNALESSNVFKTYKLDVNYRSNAEILTFANQFLDVIDANNIAKINLKASSFNKPTPKSFEQNVTVHNVQMHSSTPDEYSKAIGAVVNESNKFDKWMRNIMDNDEQVAVLGWTRKEVIDIGDRIQEWLDDNGYDIPITNIMSERSNPMSVVSTTLKNIHQDVLQLNPASKGFNNAVIKLASNFMDNKYNRSSDAQKNFFLGEFTRTFDSVVQSGHWRALAGDFGKNNIPKDAVIGHLNREMLRAETKKNAMNNHLLKADEAPNYDDEKIILSTIHGAKGLEFDHTIVLFNESKRNATSQEALRMFFVALSRAKKSEYIISGHKPNRPSSTDNISSMFVTPMDTAYMRAMNDIQKP